MKVAELRKVCSYYLYKYVLNETQKPKYRHNSNFFKWKIVPWENSWFYISANATIYENTLYEM